MSQNNRWLRQLVDSANLHGEPLPGVPIVEIAGDSRVLVERHGGVIAYDPEEIQIRVRYGLVSITGCSMELTQMTQDQLIISGQIDCIALRRR